MVTSTASREETPDFYTRQGCTHETKAGLSFMSAYDVMMLTESVEKGRAVENRRIRDFQGSQYGDHHGEVSERRRSDLKESRCLVFNIVRLEKYLSGFHLWEISYLEVEPWC